MFRNRKATMLERILPQKGRPKKRLAKEVTIGVTALMGIGAAVASAVKRGWARG